MLGVFAVVVWLRMGGWVGWEVNTMLFSDRAGLCSYWQLVTAALTYTVYHIA